MNGEIVKFPTDFPFPLASQTAVDRLWEIYASFITYTSHRKDSLHQVNTESPTLQC